MGFRRHRSTEEVELNLAAMLDMAFQLLCFFMFTFRPAPVEGQINLRLPPPMPIDGGTAPLGPTISKTEVPKGLHTLTVSIFARSKDQMSLAVGGEEVGGLTALDLKLQKTFADTTMPYEQVIVQFGDSVPYREVMKVVDVCSRQVLPDGKRLSKLSFVEVPQNAPTP